MISFYLVLCLYSERNNWIRNKNWFLKQKARSNIFLFPITALHSKFNGYDHHIREGEGWCAV